MEGWWQISLLDRSTSVNLLKTLNSNERSPMPQLRLWTAALLYYVDFQYVLWWVSKTVQSLRNIIGARCIFLILR